MLVADLWPGAAEFRSRRTSARWAACSRSARPIREHGRELWRSDGTEAGTQLVVDVNAESVGKPVPSPSVFVGSGAWTYLVSNKHPVEDRWHDRRDSTRRRQTSSDPTHVDRRGRDAVLRGPRCRSRPGTLEGRRGLGHRHARSGHLRRSRWFFAVVVGRLQWRPVLYRQRRWSRAALEERRHDRGDAARRRDFRRPRQPTQAHERRQRPILFGDRRRTWRGALEDRRHRCWHGPACATSVREQPDPIRGKSPRLAAKCSSSPTTANTDGSCGAAMAAKRGPSA